MYRALGVRITLLDERLIPVAPTGEGPATPEELDVAARIRLAAAFAAGRQVRLSAGALRAACTPIIVNGQLVGGVLTSSTRAEVSDARLSRSGFLIARAIESDQIDTDEEMSLLGRRLATLHRLLQDAGDTGTEFDVVQMFVDALSVWEDAETFAYRADLDGWYRLEVSLAGSDRAGVPAGLAAGPLTTDERVRALLPDEKDRAGFRTPRDIVWAPVAADGQAWVLAVAVSVDAAERLTWYLDSLRTALPSTNARESARLTWRTMQHLVETRAARDAVVRALGGLSAAIPAEVGFDISHVNGRFAFALGRPIDAAGRDPERAAALMRAQLDPSADLQATLELRPFGGRPFGRREQLLFEAAADTLRTWLTTAATGLVQPRERRHDQRAFERVVEGYVRDAQLVQSTALILISPGNADVTPDAIDGWIRHVRLQLRPTDLAGRLASGDVAVFALETPPDAALAVAQRLAQSLAASAQPGQPIVRVGDSRAGVWSARELVIDRASLRTVTPSPSAG